MSFMSNKGHLDFYYMVQSCAFAQNNQHWAICCVSIQNKHHYSCKLCPSQVCIWHRKTNLFNYLFSNAYHICQYSLLQWLGFMMMILLGEIYQHSARFFSPQKYHVLEAASLSTFAQVQCFAHQSKEERPSNALIIAYLQLYKSHTSFLISLYDEHCCLIHSDLL